MRARASAHARARGGCSDWLLFEREPWLRVLAAHHSPTRFPAAALLTRRAAARSSAPILSARSLLCICLAAYFEFLEADKSSPSYKPGPHWSGGAVTAIVLGVVAVAVGVAVQSRLGDRSHLMASMEDEEDDGGKRGLLNP